MDNIIHLSLVVGSSMERTIEIALHRQPSYGPRPKKVDAVSTLSYRPATFRTNLSHLLTSLYSLLNMNAASPDTSLVITSNKDNRPGISSRPPSPPRNNATTANVIQTMAVIETMKYQESTSYRALPYFDSAVVTEQDRSALCQWGLSFVDACNVDRKICSIAISYFDRFLSSRSSNIVPLCLADQGDFQLAFIVSISNIQPYYFISPLVFTYSISSPSVARLPHYRHVF